MTSLKQLRIRGGGDDIVFAVHGDAPPLIAYWGPALAAPETFSADAVRASVPQAMLETGEMLDCFPEAGRGFSGQPAVLAKRDNGSFISQVTLADASSSEHDATFTLRDKRFGLEVQLRYALDPATGVLSIASRATNTGHDRLALDWFAAAVLPTAHDDLLLFDGRWAREFMTVRQRLVTGMISKENRSGRTSHHSAPFLFAGSNDFGETAGEVICLHLGWSGNHRLFAERLRDGRVQLQAGELLLPGEVVLDAGQSYDAPTAYAARSDDGLNGISARLHPFVRKHILKDRLKKPRPVHFNSWEAVYFRQNLATMKELAERAASLGIERFVVDDGWFIGRNDDRAGLGDWTVDRTKYPAGLSPMIAHVHDLGMEFGLWVEPEMANRNSNLLRAHPDWILGEPGREQPIGRHQYVLDLTCAEIADAIFAQLDSLLRENAIDYLKWDMNCDLSHAASGVKPAARAQTLALYALVDRLRAKHPKVEIESCSSGGGRADYEVLKRFDRVWTSDCNDPIERQAIQRGFSIVFPPELMGAHVGPHRSHTTARAATMQFRALTALFGHMGVEGDIRTFTEDDELRRWIGLYKEMRPLLHGGAVHRIDDTDPGLIAFAVIAEDALVSAAQVGTQGFATQRPLRVPGLVEDTLYGARLLNASPHPERTMQRFSPLLRGEAMTLEGRVLSHHGLPMPVLHAGETAVWHLKRGAR